MLERSIQKLKDLGHQRIIVLHDVIFVGEGDELSRAEMAVDQFLQEAGLAGSIYNSPRWGKTPEDLKRSLERYFSLTPPTALIVSEVWMLPIVFSFFIRKKLQYPEDISLICLDYSPMLDHCFPKVSYVKKPAESFAKKVISMIDQIYLDPTKPQLIQELVSGELFITGSIGPARGGEPHRM